MGRVKLNKRKINYIIRAKINCYVYLKTIKDNPMSKVGTEIIGYEFHYSKLPLNEKVHFKYKVTRGYDIDGSYDVIIKDIRLASYTPIYKPYPPVLYNLLKNMEQKSRGSINIL